MKLLLKIKYLIEKLISKMCGIKIESIEIKNDVIKITEKRRCSCGDKIIVHSELYKNCNCSPPQCKKCSDTKKDQD